MEQKLTLYQTQVEKTKSELQITKEKLAGREENLIELTKRRSSARKSLDKVKEQKLHTDIEITKLRSIKLDLEKKLTDAVAKITNLEKQLIVNVRNSEEMERKILIKEIEIQNKEQEMLNKIKALLKKDEEIQNLKIEITDRDKEIELLKEEINNQINKTNVEIKKFSAFEVQLSEANTASIILDKIKELVIVKGFLSDKEFEYLIKEGDE